MKIVKKFGDYKIVCTEINNGQHKVEIFLRNDMIMDALIVGCEKHLDDLIMQFAGQFLTKCREEFKARRKALKQAMEELDKALEEMKL